VALLDEPSTGLDPGARRAMWSTLQGPHVLKAGGAACARAERVCVCVGVGVCVD